ncbi:hypothetical protein M2175_003845 [Bradyrhizobium elkanii]|nr:hypothetical protein [Bradyrhizobium elkanii]MCS3969368.1 hypothetical protein [Bradyrhizobium japonicum]
MIIRAVLHQQIEKAEAPLPVSMTWLVGPLFDCTLAIMACGSSGAIVPRPMRTPIDGCQLPPNFSIVAAPSPILCQSSRFAELKRWQPQLFTLSRTTTSTTSSYAPTLGRIGPTREAAERDAQAIAQEREAELVVHLPSGKTNRTRFAKSWAACFGDAPAESGDALLHLHAIDMLAGPCQQFRQGHDTGHARNLPAVVQEHQCRYALDENRRSSSCTAWLSTLTSRKSGSTWVAACSKIGAIARQGPH